MKEFFKFFGLSFFSDKITAQAPERRVYSHFVALFIAFVLFVATLVCADFASFPIQYNDADGFNSLIGNAFASEDISSRISLKVQGGRITAAKGDGELVKAKIINSFTDDAEYAVAGYNIVVDTRSMTAYDAFEADFEGTGITAEQYDALAFSAKKNFKPEIVLTDKEQVLTDEYVSACCEYLSGMGDVTGQNYDKSISERYQAILDSAADEQTKNKQIYELYLQAYYPSIFNSESGFPNLRNYYANTYMENPEVSRYLFVFEDMLVGSFETGSGITRMFYGYASHLDNGMAVTASGSAAAQKQMDEFIKTAYNGSLGISTYLYFINSRRIFLFAIVIWLGLALIAFGLSRALKRKRDIPKKFGEWFKISGSFILWSSIITALVGCICGFFVSLNTVFSMITPLFGGIMFARLAVFFITAAVKKRESAEDSDAVSETVSDDVFEIENGKEQSDERCTDGAIVNDNKTVTREITA